MNGELRNDDSYLKFSCGFMVLSLFVFIVKGINNEFTIHYHPTIGIDILLNTATNMLSAFLS